MILLDSDIVVDIWRGNATAVAWVRSLGREEIVISGYVGMELLKGCRNKHELSVAETILSQFRMVWPDAACCAAAYNTYRSVHLTNAIGILDVMIGHTALAMGLPLHTFNQKHFNALTGLVTIRPYTR